MNFQIAIRKFVASLREAGVAATLRRAAAYLPGRNEVDAFDRERGVDTTGVSPIWRQSIGSKNAAHGIRYQTRPEDELRAAISAVPCEPNKTTFVDLGCGKGRPLIVAHELGFADIIGVEFSRELSESAKSNLSGRARIILGDAADFTFPDVPLLLYMYHPFHEVVMQAVVDNLRKHTSDLWILYLNPVHSNVLGNSGFLERFAAEPPIWRKRWTG